MITTALKRYAVVSSVTLITSLVFATVAFQQEKTKHPLLSSRTIFKRIRSRPIGKLVYVINGLIQAPWQIPALFLAGLL